MAEETSEPVAAAAADSGASITIGSDGRLYCHDLTPDLLSILATLCASNTELQARQAAAETGDLSVLSPADLDVLAKALEYGATVATDDYAVQNVALHLGLKIQAIGQPRIRRKLKRVQRCRGCGSRFEGEDCPDCGTLAPKKKRCI